MEPIALERMSLTHVRVPLHEPFVISNGVVSEKDAILVEVFAGGLVGLGEASPMAGSFYSHHTPESCWAALTERLIPRMNESGRIDLAGGWLPADFDDPFATCGVDNALWDLVARVRGRPLWALLGRAASTPAVSSSVVRSANQPLPPPGIQDPKSKIQNHVGYPQCTTPRPVESGLAVGIYPTIDDLLDRIGRYLQADGYRRVKIKVRPGWDVEPLEAVRRRFGDVPLMVDANCAYRREHIDHIAAWDRFGLMMIEQPLPRTDLEGHAELAARCRTPICLDEGAESVQAVERAIALRAAGVVNIKLQRLGSMAAALRVHELTATAGIGCWMGTMPELAVGGYAAIHFATLPNIAYPADVESSGRWFVADVTDPPIRCRDGLLSLPHGPGLGVQLDAAVVNRYKVREWSVRPACTLILED